MSQSQHVVGKAAPLPGFLRLPCFRILVLLIPVWNQTLVYLKLAGLKFDCNVAE